MALHTELNLDIKTYGTSVKENCNFSFKLDGKVLDVFDQESSGRVKLAAAASDVEFDFQQVTDGQLILLKSDDEFTVKINGIGNPALTVMPRTNSETTVETPGILALMGDSITSLHLANPGASDIYVDVAVAGT